ncbi:type I 3-dehydroquinate dehydratase [Haladaptatus caseinilyticus]|uniref:type I 3-dehydroquinate dehydratase n=1 Tax=Haladaptatus caseinilyticus TaxID=2993314 RepID=UPI00224A5305|nr:type I 3-dehydroquinate dehydratase [Haladaptatus caseinilyticus]
MDYDDLVLIAELDELSDEPTVRPYADAIAIQMWSSENIVNQIERYSGELPVVIIAHSDKSNNTSFSDSNIDSLQAVVEHDTVEAISIDLDSIQKEVRLFKCLESADVDVIISYINNNSTPVKSDLMSIIDGATNFGDVVYIQTAAKTTNDTSTLLSVINEATDQGIITGGVATGKIGRHTRAIAPFYGSKLAFAPLSQSKNDNSQHSFAIKELSNLISDIEYSDTTTSLSDLITNPLITEFNE